MITVINFSHPLADEAKEQIKSRYGAGDAQFIRIRVQVNVEAPLVLFAEKSFVSMPLKIKTDLIPLAIVDAATVPCGLINPTNNLSCKLWFSLNTQKILWNMQPHWPKNFRPFTSSPTTTR